MREGCIDCPSGTVTRGFHFGPTSGPYVLISLPGADHTGDVFSTVARGIVRPMFIYKERDVERRAWEKHGGSEGFDR